MNKELAESLYETFIVQTQDIDTDMKPIKILEENINIYKATNDCCTRRIVFPNLLNIQMIGNGSGGRYYFYNNRLNKFIELGMKRC